MTHKTLAALLSHVLLAVELAACATAEPSHDALQKGALTRPPPAQQRPGVGLPQPHLPGQHVGPKVEPNPRPKRYLPPTPGGGPGIWASKAPTEWDRHLFGLELPVPPDAEDYDTRMVSHCAGAMHMALTNPDRRVAPGIQPKDAPCLYAGLFRFCAEKMVLHSNPGKAARHEAVRRAARDFHLKMCTKEQLEDKTVRAVAAAIRDTWARSDIHTTVPFE
jgi:hypothetical protein